MEQQKFEFINEYFEQLENYRDNYNQNINENSENELFDLIMEIKNVFEKEMPEINNSILLRSGTGIRDANTTLGIIKKYLIENGYKKLGKQNKLDEQLQKLITSLNLYFERELPYKDYLKQEYIRYDNWDGGTYYNDIDYNYQYTLHYGIDYQDIRNVIDIKMFVELAFSEWIKPDKRYDFTKEINNLFSKFKIGYKLQKGKIIKEGYKTTNFTEKIINYNMLERKIQYAEEMILSQETLDKKSALDYIIDSLQYIISIQDGKGVSDKYSLASQKISDNKNGKVYSVIKAEIEELMKISNEYFDIRHNEYLNKSKEKREAITDSTFIEYLYNRAYSLLYILRLKQ